MKSLPVITTSRDTIGRLLHWMHTSESGPRVKVAKWWADVAIRKRLAKDCREKEGECR